MSQLRKSASFRSRIPVRRNRLPVRRCCSPQPLTTSTSACVIKSNREQSINQSNQQQHHHHNHHNHSQHSQNQWLERRYSSSSYSSSDESEESEAPLQRLLKESTSQGLSRMITVSTDAMSLDGLLDSVSSGSFSDTPSSPTGNFRKKPPVKSQLKTLHSSYESLERLHCDVETLKLTNNFNKPNNHNQTQVNQNRIYMNENNHIDHDDDEDDDNVEGNDTIKIDNHKQRFHPSMKNHISQQNYTRNISGSMNQFSILIDENEDIGDEEINEDENLKMLEELEKQKQLSDWYYIKTSPKPKQINSSTRVDQHQQQHNPQHNMDRKHKILAKIQQKHIFNKSHGHHHNKKFNETNNLNRGSSPFLNHPSPTVVNNNPHNNNEHFYQNTHFELTEKSTQTILLNEDKPKHLIKTQQLSPLQSRRLIFNNFIKQNNFYDLRDSSNHERESLTSSYWDSSGGRFGETSSSSFEHVNMTNYKSDKLLFLSTSNSSGNMIQSDYVNSEMKYNAAKSRPLPQVPKDDVISEVSGVFICLFCFVV